jgi:hypothetical protein
MNSYELAIHLAKAEAALYEAKGQLEEAQDETAQAYLSRVQMYPAAKNVRENIQQLTDVVAGLKRLHAAAQGAELLQAPLA